MFSNEEEENMYDETTRQERAQRELYEALRTGFAEQVRKCLDSGADARKSFGMMESPIFFFMSYALHRPEEKASLTNLKDILRLLIERGADINQQDDNGITPLMKISKTGPNAGRLIQIMLDAGASIDFTDNEGKTALFHAISSNCMANVTRLLRGGANIEIRDANGRTPLHTACEAGSSSMLRFLGECGANPNVRDAKGGTPLMSASKRDLLDNVEYIVELGADLDAADDKGMTALHVACSKGQYKVVDMLLNKGANPMKENVEGFFPNDLLESSYLTERLQEKMRILERLGLSMISGVNGVKGRLQRKAQSGGPTPVEPLMKTPELK